MCKAQCVLVVALLVGLAHSWDIAITVGDRIEFYTKYGAKIETANLPSQNLTALVYDEVHNMLLYIDKQNNNDAICGYSMSRKDHKCFVERNGRSFHGLAFDAASDTLFFTATDERSINTFSFKHGSTNNVHGNLLIKLDSGMPTDIAVDSCRGYVYWINNHMPKSTIERARFDGSGREVIIYATSEEAIPYLNDIHSVVIDQETRKLIWSMPWSRTYTYTYITDLNGNNRNSIMTWSTDIYTLYPNTFAFLKNELYSTTCSMCPMKSVYKFTKPSYTASKITDVYYSKGVAIASNYKMSEQFDGIPECSHLLNMICGLEESFEIAKESEASFCVHGTKVSGQSLCKCLPGYSGDHCEISVCENYCFQGNCSFTEQGNPICRCEAGYSGERCEVNVCHGYCSNSGTCSLDDDNQPTCQCHGYYVGHRCEISGCQNYCFRGYCSFTKQGHPTCRCEAGYSGERCEVNVCHGYCSNSGTCSLDDDSQPTCQCHGYYVGHRCEIYGCQNYCFRGYCSFTKQGHPTCSCEAGYSGQRCEVNVCTGHCLNSGSCSLNEEDEPACECVGEYEGDRCEVPKV